MFACDEAFSHPAQSTLWGAANWCGDAISNLGTLAFEILSGAHPERRR